MAYLRKSARLISAFVVYSSVLFLTSAWCYGAISEPTQLLYGAVSIDGTLVTQSDTDAVVILQYEGQVVDRFQFGRNTQPGDWYVLKVPVSIAGAESPTTLQPGSTFQVVFQRGETKIKGADVQVSDRGSVMELNLFLNSGNAYTGDGADSVIRDFDEDGISDEAEIAAGLDPFNPDDALQDKDGDGISNLDEHLAGTDLNADSVSPYVIAPADVQVSATGLFTKVQTGTAAAYDDKDGYLTATYGGDGYFAPGVHTIEWQTADAAGNAASDSQHVRVKPIVNFEQDQTVAEGSYVDLVVELNGAAVLYPVTVPYTVTGTASAGEDHMLYTGTITLNSGTRGAVRFWVADNDDVESETETIEVTMGTPTNAVAGLKDRIEFSLTESNLAPIVELSSMQNLSETTVIVNSAGLVTVTANASDSGVEALIYDWSQTDAELVDVDANSSDNSFSFSPELLPEGIYQLEVSVTDAGGLSAYASLLVQVLADAPVLSGNDSDGDGRSDSAEGYGDADFDGLANYLDAFAQSNVMPKYKGQYGHSIIETHTGVKLSLGALAMLGSQVSVTPDDVKSQYPAASLPRLSAASELFDVQLSQLSLLTDVGSVVLPLAKPVSQNSELYLFSHSDGSERLFASDANSRVLSALGAQGYCPPVDSPEYANGLNMGDWCVKLVIEDNGVNDSLSGLTGTIGITVGLVDEIVVVIQEPESEPEPEPDTPSSGGKKGGSADPLILLLMALLFICARNVSFRKA